MGVYNRNNTDLLNIWNEYIYSVVSDWFENSTVQVIVNSSGIVVDDRFENWVDSKDGIVSVVGVLQNTQSLDGESLAGMNIGSESYVGNSIEIEAGYQYDVYMKVLISSINE